MSDIAELRTSVLESSKLDKETILLFGPSRRFSTSVVSAIASEFPNHEIVFNDSLRNALDCSREQCAKASLVILDESFCQSLIEHEVEVRGLFPSTPIALAFDGDMISHECWHHCEPFFSGFVAFDVHLDIWLSTIRLLLAGGEYIPPRLISRLGKPTPVDSGNDPAGSANRRLVSISPPSTEPPQRSVSTLTCREMDVLKLVARGRQNKLIAAELKLSEHTVKLHLHHIISKLGVTNRTEAAACFLNDQDVLSRSA